MKRLGVLSITSGALAVAIAVLSQSVTQADTRVCTWTGGAGTNRNWSAPQNWNCTDGTVPGNGTTLVFPKDSIKVHGDLGYNHDTSNKVINDLPATNVYAGIKFETKDYIASDNYYGSYTASYTVNGNALKVSGDIITDEGKTRKWYQAAQIKTAVEATAPLTLSSVGIDSLSIGAHNVTLKDASVDKLAGSGDITVAKRDGIGSSGIGGDNSTSFTGSIIAESGGLYIRHEKALGSIDKGTVIKDGASLGGCLDRSMTIHEPLTFIGHSDNDDWGKISFLGCRGAGADDGIETYWSISSYDGIEMTFAGDVAVQQADLKVASIAERVKFTGNIAAPGVGIKLVPRNAGLLVIDSPNNTSTTPNNTYENDRIKVTLSDETNKRLYVSGIYDVCVTGARTGVSAYDGKKYGSDIYGGAVLCGTGRLSPVGIRGGRLSPGVDGAGVIHTEDLTFSRAEHARPSLQESHLDIQLGGKSLGRYDQADVTGTVSIADTNLNVSIINDFKPAIGDTFTIIKNDANDPVTGTFKNLPEGAMVTVDGYQFAISYRGGDGNDIVLTTRAVPAAPSPDAEQQAEANALAAITKVEQSKRLSDINDAKSKVAAVKNQDKKAEFEQRINAIEAAFNAKKAELQQKIAEAENPATTNGKSEQTKNELANAVASAKAAIGGTDPSQADFERELAALREKINNLQADKAALQALINSIPNQSSFVQNNANVQEKLRAANSVNGRAGATADDITSAVNELQQAISDAKAAEAEINAEQARQAEATAAIAEAKKQGQRSPKFFDAAQKKIDAVRTTDKKAGLQTELDGLKEAYRTKLSELQALLKTVKKPGVTSGVTATTKQVLDAVINDAEQIAAQGMADQGEYSTFINDLQDALDGLRADKQPLDDAIAIYDSKPDYIKNNSGVMAAFRKAQATKAAVNPLVKQVRDDAKSLIDAITDAELTHEDTNKAGAPVEKQNKPVKANTDSLADTGLAVVAPVGVGIASIIAGVWIAIRHKRF